MNRKEYERIFHLENSLSQLGFNEPEVRALRRISNTLQRWFEKECGSDHGAIERDEATGKPYWINSMSGNRFPARDLESGARKRLAAILNDKQLGAYIQTDPRGAALYILRPGDVPEGESVDSYYTRGICVY